jgi:Tfp pilus assembly PilM family ATPase
MEQIKTKPLKNRELTPPDVLNGDDTFKVEKNITKNENGFSKANSAVADKSYKSISTSFSEKPTFVQSLSAQNFISIDIDIDSIRYIIGTSSGRSIFVKDMGIAIIPSEGDNHDKAVKLTLDNIKANVYKSGYNIHTSFFSPDVTLRQYTVPKMRKASELKNALFYMLQSDLPGFNEDSEWRYKIIDRPHEEDSNLENVIVLVVPGKVIHKYMGLLNSAGLAPATLVPRAVAVAQGFNRMVNNNIADMVVDISYDITHICYMRYGQLEFTRSLATGASNLEIAVHEKQDKILGPDSFQLKEEDGVSKKGALRPEMIRKVLTQRLRSLQAHQNPVLQLFKNELQHSLDHFDSLDKNQKVERIFLTGYGVQKESLLFFLKNNMKIPVFVLSPKLTENGTDVLKSGRYFSTLGTVADPKDVFNLVPQAYRSEVMFQRLNYIVGSLFILTIAIMGYLTNLSYKNIDRLTVEFEQVNKKYEELNPVEVEYQSIQADIQKLIKDQEKFKKIIIDSAPILEILKLISNETPEQIILTELSLNSSNLVKMRRKKGRKSKKEKSVKDKNTSYSIRISGTVNGDYLMSDVILINYIDHLKNLEYFTSIDVADKNKKNAKQKMQFEIKAKL